MTLDRVRRAEVAGYVAAVAGAAALVTVALHSSDGELFGTLSAIFLLAMTLAIAPMMLGAYELGGVTPLWPARLSLVTGIGAVLVASSAQALTVAALLTPGREGPASGSVAVEAVALLVVGAWLAGAPLLAGPWLPTPLRWLGAVSGAALVLFGLGLWLGGVNNPLASVGGIGYRILFPSWAFLFARLLSMRDRRA